MKSSTAIPKHTHVLDVNSIVSESSVKEVMRNAAIQSSIDDLNQMWNNHRYFDVTVISSIADRFGYGSFYASGNQKAEYLRSFHCVYWNKMSDETRKSIALVLISYFNERRFGYDFVTGQWLDTKTCPTIIEGKNNVLILAHESAESAESAEQSKTSWLSNLKKWLFEKS